MLGFRKMTTIGAALAFGAAVSLLAPANPAWAQAGKTYVMKLSTATINDTQHEWLKRFAALVEKDSGGRIKAEVYPASQLGAIPRQIEGVQFGSIQVWMGPPEFLVGVDERFEAMTAPGLFTDHDQVMRIMLDPETQKMVYGLGAAKGVIGMGFAPMSPSAILVKKPVKQLSDMKGLKVRVLASPFQLELMRRMDMSPVAMTLADVLPALQQGTIDGTLSSPIIFTTMHYYDTAKYAVETEQPYVNSLAIVSKRWMDTLPPDLQKIVMDDAAKVTNEITPFVKDFWGKQLTFWKEKGGQMVKLPKAEHDAMIAKVSTIGDDLSKSKPGLNQTVKALFASAARHKK